MDNRCHVWFENEQGDTVLKVSMDESSWIFASAPVGRIYLSYVVCTTSLMGVHPGLKTRKLFFPVVASNPTYFGHLTIHFNYHGTQAFGMFGLVGGAIDAASSSGSTDQNEFEIENQIDQAKVEFEKRYGGSGNSLKLIEGIIEKPASKPSPEKM